MRRPYLGVGLAFLLSLVVASQQIVLAGVVTATVAGQSVPLGNLNYSLNASGDNFVNEMPARLC